MILYNKILLIFLIVLLYYDVKSVESFCHDDHLNDCRCDESKGPCFRKCCPFGQIHDIVKGICKKNDKINQNSVKISFEDELIGKLYTLGNVRDNLIIGIPCKGYKTKAFDVDFNSTFLKDGRLKNKSRGKILPPQDFCSDFMNESRGVLSVMYCFRNDPIIRDEDYLQFAFIWVSIPFLILTVIIFFWIKGLSNNIAGKIVVSQIGSLIVAFITLGDAKIYYLVKNQYICSIFGYITLFSLLANFFWLNVMCFDIWLVFSGLTTPYRHLTRREELTKFLKYSLYAWGLPLIICICVYLSDLFLPETSVIKPNIGIEMCSFSNGSKWLFYFGPLTILLLANIFMFGGTSYKIFIHERQTQVLRAGENQCSNSEKERFYLYLKLFLVMGITWISEPLSVTFKSWYWFWFFWDCFNLLQGIPIFIIFVCKRRTLAAINAKLCPSIVIFTTLRRESTIFSPYTTTSSSGGMTLSRAPRKSNASLKSNSSGYDSRKHSQVTMVPDKLENIE